MSVPTFVADLRRQVGPDFPLIGAGGVLSGADAQEKIFAGANLVQVYTGFIYRGPALIRECAKATGMKPLRLDGLEKVKAGLTTLDEIYRVTA